MSSGDGVTVTMELEIKPEAVAAFRETLPIFLQDTARRDGFRSIRIVGHKDDEKRLLIVEHWDREEDYRSYIAWRMERGDMDMLAENTTRVQIEIWPTPLLEIGKL